jgi:hypothetical protein
MLYCAYTVVIDVRSAEPFTLRGKMPGWDLHSYGYHSDDGGAFHNAGSMLYKYGECTDMHVIKKKHILVAVCLMHVTQRMCYYTSCTCLHIAACRTCIAVVTLCCCCT